jgi:hypothetical protein
MGTSEHGNEPLAGIKGRVFLDQLSDFQLLRKASTLCG